MVLVVQAGQDATLMAKYLRFMLMQHMRTCTGLP